MPLCFMCFVRECDAGQLDLLETKLREAHIPSPMILKRASGMPVILASWHPRGGAIARYAPSELFTDPNRGQELGVFIDAYLAEFHARTLCHRIE